MLIRILFYLKQASKQASKQNILTVWRLSGTVLSRGTFAMLFSATGCGLFVMKTLEDER